MWNKIFSATSYRCCNTLLLELYQSIHCADLTTQLLDKDSYKLSLQSHDDCSSYVETDLGPTSVKRVLEGKGYDIYLNYTLSQK